MVRSVERNRFLYTGTGDLNSPFFSGRVTLLLDAAQGEIQVFVPQFNFTRGANLRDQFETEAEQAQLLENVSITLPLGQIQAAQLTGLRFLSYEPGTLSVFNTPVSSLLELRQRTGISVLRLRPESGRLQFGISANFGTELIFGSHSISVSPATPVCDATSSLVADDEFTHFNSASTENHNTDFIRIAWSIVGGSYVFPFIECDERSITFFSYQKPEKTIATLVAHPQSPDEYGALAPRCFDSVYRFLLGLNDQDRNEFVNIVPLYLDAKRQRTSVEGNVLNIFSFIEARDGSRTLSWQTLGTMLNIDRAEAEFIIFVRNQFGHGRLSLAGAIDQERQRIQNSQIFQGLGSRYREVEFYYCLLMLVDAYLCRLFGLRTNGWQYTPGLASIRAQ